MDWVVLGAVGIVVTACVLVSRWAKARRLAIQDAQTVEYQRRYLYAEENTRQMHKQLADNIERVAALAEQRARLARVVHTGMHATWQAKYVSPFGDVEPSCGEVSQHD